MAARGLFRGLFHQNIKLFGSKPLQSLHNQHRNVCLLLVHRNVWISSCGGCVKQNNFKGKF